MLQLAVEWSFRDNFFNAYLYPHYGILSISQNQFFWLCVWFLRSHHIFYVRNWMTVCIQCVYQIWGLCRYHCHGFLFTQGGIMNRSSPNLVYTLTIPSQKIWTRAWCCSVTTTSVQNSDTKLFEHPSYLTKFYNLSWIHNNRKITITSNRKLISCFGKIILHLDYQFFMKKKNLILLPLEAK